MEFNPPEINVNVTSPADAAKKLPEVREAARDAQVFADKASGYAQALAAMVKYLETLSESEVTVAPQTAAGDSGADAVIKVGDSLVLVEGKSDRPETSEEAILRIVENANGPITIGDVREAHPEFAYDTLRGRFKDLAKEGKIERVKRGLYIWPGLLEQVSLPTNGDGGSEE